MDAIHGDSWVVCFSPHTRCFNPLQPSEESTAPAPSSSCLCPSSHFNTKTTHDAAPYAVSTRLGLLGSVWGTLRLWSAASCSQARSRVKPLIQEMGTMVGGEVESLKVRGVQNLAAQHTASSPNNIVTGVTPRGCVRGAEGTTRWLRVRVWVQGGGGGVLGRVFVLCWLMG